MADLGPVMENLDSSHSYSDLAAPNLDLAAPKPAAPDPNQAYPTCIELGP